MPDSKYYSNGKLVIKWDSLKCKNSGVCVKGLPQVFNKSKDPWIDLNEGTIEGIVKQLGLCPNKAFKLIGKKPIEQKLNPAKVFVKVTPDGPLIVDGDFELEFVNGKKMIFNGSQALCRCNLSKNKPFCDGSHRSLK